MSKSTMNKKNRRNARKTKNKHAVQKMNTHDHVTVPPLEDYFDANSPLHGSPSSLYDLICSYSETHGHLAAHALNMLGILPEKPSIDRQTLLLVLISVETIELAARILDFEDLRMAQTHEELQQVLVAADDSAWNEAMLDLPAFKVLDDVVGQQGSFSCPGRFIVTLLEATAVVIAMYLKHEHHHQHHHVCSE